MDDDAVIKPAECREIAGVVVAVDRARLDVVRLEPLSGPAPIDRAGPAVAMDDATAGAGRDGGGRITPTVRSNEH